jgi:hypothetical protein
MSGCASFEALLNFPKFACKVVVRYDMQRLQLLANGGHSFYDGFYSHVKALS